MDHLLRQEPSSRLTAIRQSFFSRGIDRTSLGKSVEAFKGVYQTIRACHGGRLAVNVDVANGTFWIPTTMLQTVIWLTASDDFEQMIDRLRDVRKYSEEKKDWFMERSPGWLELRRLHKLAIVAKHRGSEDKNRLFYVSHFIKEDAKEYTFPVRDKQTGEITTTNVYDYFLRKYDIRLQRWKTPLIQTTKKGVVFPMEVVMVSPNQRYPFKLDDLQTAKMIKFAVTPPEVRQREIASGLKMLNWSADPFLRNYGMQIDPNMVTTKARLLAPPAVQFADGKAAPGYAGRWDLRGKKFLLPNPKPLVSWGVCIYPHKPHIQTYISKALVQDFIRDFIKTYTQHGGRVANKSPVILEGPMDPAKCVEELWTLTGNACNLRPQMLFFIMPGRESITYLRIKKSADCRFGVVSQCTCPAPSPSSGMAARLRGLTSAGQACKRRM